jgi:hypothetical protein
MTLLGVVDNLLASNDSKSPKKAGLKKKISKGTENVEATPAVPVIVEPKKDEEYDYKGRYNTRIPEDADQAIVSTPYGRGLVIRTRKNPVTHTVVSRDIELLDWNKSQPRSGPPKPAMLHSATKYPSVAAEVEDEVTCAFGRGRVVSINGTKIQVQLSSWRLAGRSKVTCFLTPDAVQVVRPKKLHAMTVFERVEHAQKLKEQAKEAFTKKEYERALSKYALAVDAVRYVQHQKDSTNEVRADLLVLMITCCNNAATCSMNDGQRWEMVSKYAKNALVLIDALEGKQCPEGTKQSKIMEILIKDGYDQATIFGEWKSKSLLFLAKAEQGNQNYAKAMEHCKKTHDIVSKCLAAFPDNKVFAQQAKEASRIHAACKEGKQKLLKKEKQRALAMFGGGDVNKDSQKESAEPKNNTESTASTNGSTAKVEKLERKADKETVPSSSQLMDDASKKSVTFEDGGRPRDVYEKKSSLSGSNDEDDVDNEAELPWYLEHQELIILAAGLAFLGLAATQFARNTRRS